MKSPGMQSSAVEARKLGLNGVAACSVALEVSSAVSELASEMSSAA
jgi:hypothetical protein